MTSGVKRNFLISQNRKRRMKIGDAISVVDDQLKGKIISIKGKNVTIEDEHGFSYDYELKEIVLQEPEIYKGLKTIQKVEKSKPTSKKHDKKPLVVDLHFSNMVKNPAQFSPFERITLQKEKLLETLDYCRENNLKKLEIIHGIGDGIVQQMVNEVLANQKNLEYHNKEILHHQSGTVLVYLL